MNIFPKVYLRRPWINQSFTANTPYTIFFLYSFAKAFFSDRDKEENFP